MCIQQNVSKELNTNYLETKSDSEGPTFSATQFFPSGCTTEVEHLKMYYFNLPVLGCPRLRSCLTSLFVRMTCDHPIGSSPTCLSESHRLFFHKLRGAPAVKLFPLAPCGLGSHFAQTPHGTGELGTESKYQSFT